MIARLRAAWDAGLLGFWDAWALVRQCWWI